MIENSTVLILRFAYLEEDEGKPYEAGEQRAIEIGVYIWNKYNRK